MTVKHTPCVANLSCMFSTECAKLTSVWLTFTLKLQADIKTQTNMYMYIDGELACVEPLVSASHISILH